MTSSFLSIRVSSVSMNFYMERKPLTLASLCQFLQMLMSISKFSMTNLEQHRFVQILTMLKILFASICDPTIPNSFTSNKPDIGEMFFLGSPPCQKVLIFIINDMFDLKMCQLFFDYQKNHVFIHVATLTLGLRPKQRGLQSCGPRGSPRITTHAPRSVRKCEGMNLHTPNVTLTLGDGISVYSRIFKRQLQGSKLNGLKISLYR